MALSEKRVRLNYFAFGFLCGWFFFMLYSSLRLWPFEEDAVFKWMRWAGKESIKWGFVAIITAITFFIAAQVINATWGTDENLDNDD